MLLLPLIIVIIAVYSSPQNVHADENNFFLKASKSVPRIGRNSQKPPPSNGDFEKFFLKASKSVPRIGRRNEPIPFSSPYFKANQNYDRKFKYPTWSEIADRYEYEPELFDSAEVLEQLEKEVGDDPSIYEWDKVRIKKAAPLNMDSTY